MRDDYASIGDLKAKKKNVHTDRVNCVAFSLDGKIVSGSDDLSLKVWDPGVSVPTLSNPSLRPPLTASVLEAASIELKVEKQGAHSGMVRSVAFSPDDKSIVSCSGDRALKVWDAGTLPRPTPDLPQP